MVSPVVKRRSRYAQQRALLVDWQSKGPFWAFWLRQLKIYQITEVRSVKSIIVCKFTFEQFL
jgi:hypothetical protein